MRLLIDTHIFLWFIFDDPQLRQALRKMLEDENNDIYVSMASLCEMAIKVSAGKLFFQEPFAIYIPEQIRLNGIRLLPVEWPHVLRVATMPFHHRDPFDRLLIAQSLEENPPILSVDSIFDAYGVTRLF